MGAWQRSPRLRSGSPASWDAADRTPAFKHCTLPACADESDLTGPTYTGGWSAGDDGRLHYITGLTGGSNCSHYSVLFDNTGASTLPFTISPSYWYMSSFHGGEVGKLSVYLVQTASMGRFQYRTLNLTTGIGGNPSNTGRVARASIRLSGNGPGGTTVAAALNHSNAGGATASYTPHQQIALPPAAPVPATLTGVSAPLPATDPTLLAVSAMGATVTNPTVVVVRGGNVEACPLATPCAAWIDLGALGSVLNLDGQHLYVGTATGLKRCALSEIGTLGKCTLSAFGPSEAVSAPLFPTTTDARYLSGTRVRRVAK